MASFCNNEDKIGEGLNHLFVEHNNMASFCNNEDKIGEGLNHVTSTVITPKRRGFILASRGFNQIPIYI